MAETSAPPTTVGVGLSDPTRYGVEVRVKVGDVEFVFLPDAAPLPEGATVRRYPIIDDPVLQGIVIGALLGACNRLEEAS